MVRWWSLFPRHGRGFTDDLTGFVYGKDDQAIWLDRR